MSQSGTTGPPRNVTSVGGIVIGPAGVLLVRMTYGASRGRYMIPGGIVDPGETLDDAVVREVLEETGVEARAIGICGVRSRYDWRDNDTYILFLLEPVRGEPRSDGRENDDARYFRADELVREDVTDLAEYLGQAALAGALTTLTLAADFDAGARGRDPRAWKLFR